MNTQKLKTIPRRSSITARITILVSFELILIVLLTFLMFRFVSASILQRTVRGYLLGSVNANIDKIRFIPEGTEQKSRDNDNTLLLMEEGSLEIDDDFLDEIYDVQSALYREDGTLLYGKNPLARSMDGVSFTGSRIYRYRDAQGGQWYVYDRKLSSTGREALWNPHIPGHLFCLDHRSPGAESAPEDPSDCCGNHAGQGSAPQDRHRRG